MISFTFDTLAITRSLLFFSWGTGWSIFMQGGGSEELLNKTADAFSSQTQRLTISQFRLRKNGTAWALYCGKNKQLASCAGCVTRHCGQSYSRLFDTIVAECRFISISKQLAQRNHWSPSKKKKTMTTFGTNKLKPQKIGWHLPT